MRGMTTNVKLKERIRNTILRHRARVSDIIDYVTKAKWKRDGHIARMNDNRWTIRSTDMADKGRQISWKTKTSLER